MVKSVPTWLRARKNLDVSAARTVGGWKLMYSRSLEAYVHVQVTYKYLASYPGCLSKKNKTNKQINKQKNKKKTEAWVQDHALL